MTIGIIVCIGVTTSGTTPSLPNAVPPLHNDEAIQHFFDYHGTDKVSSHKTSHKDAATAVEDCPPCAAKAAALKAGGVPSTRPAPKVDVPYQRITGRLPDFTYPSEEGTCKVGRLDIIDAWVSISHGIPFQQLRCHILLSDSGITLSSVSGEITQEKVELIPWHATTPVTLGIWGPLIQKSASDIWLTMHEATSPISTGQQHGRFHVRAVSSQRILFVASSPSELEWDDVEIRLTTEGAPISITHIQSTRMDAALVATRQIWFINPN